MNTNTKSQTQSECSDMIFNVFDENGLKWNNSKWIRILVNNIFNGFEFCDCSNCDGVILPKLDAVRLQGKEQEFCPRCECKYENRNTAIIKVVVIIVIWVISLLVVYMLFLICLDPLLNKRIKNSYQEHTNEDVCSTD